MHPKLILPLVLFLTLSVAGLEVTRTLPETVQEWEEFTVTLSFDFNRSETLQACVFGERYPANWTVISWSEIYYHEKVQNDSVIYWGTIIDFSKEAFLSDFEFTYTVQVPVRVSNNFTGEFAGVGVCFNIDNSTRDFRQNITFNTTGDRLVKVLLRITHPADTNRDGIISDFELLDYVDLWVEGRVDDFDVLAAIDFWASRT